MTGPLWAVRLAELGLEFRQRRPADDAELMEELWLLLTAAVTRFLRHHRRNLPPLSEEDGEDLVTQKSLELLERIDSSTWEPDPAAPEVVAGYVSSCIRNALQPRHRTIWIFRIFYELRTKAIADHPEIGLKPGHVDVILHQCRQKVTECMAAKGLQARDMPPGCYAALWRAFRATVNA